MVIIVLAIGLSLVHGCLSGVTMRQAGAGVLGLLGIMAALFVSVTLVAAFVVALQRPWTRTVVRVAGSWIAAIGLLMLGWSVHGGNCKGVIDCERFGAQLLLSLIVLSKPCIDHDIGGGYNRYNVHGCCLL